MLIGPAVHFYADNHAFGSRSVPIIDQGFDSITPIRVCRGAWIGGNVVIMSGVTIGQNAVVGAGSVVTKDVPPFSVCVGNPARVIKTIGDSDS